MNLKAVSVTAANVVIFTFRCFRKIVFFSTIVQIFRTFPEKHPDFSEHTSFFRAVFGKMTRKFQRNPENRIFVNLREFMTIKANIGHYIHIPHIPRPAKKTHGMPHLMEEAPTHPKIPMYKKAVILLTISCSKS